MVFHKLVISILSQKKKRTLQITYMKHCQEAVSDGLNFTWIVKEVLGKCMNRDIHYSIIFYIQKAEQIIYPSKRNGYIMILVT